MNPVSLDDAARLAGPLAFNILIKPAGSLCNLGCTYCYYLDKSALYGGREPRMSLETLEGVVKACLEAHEVADVHFLWHGGEPLLLGLDFFRKAVSFQRKYAGDKRVFNAIQTNGTLLDASRGRFFRETRFLVGLSLDGPEDLHNQFRRSKGGEPTFHKTMEGPRILQGEGVEFNTLSTVNRASEGRGAEVYQFLKAAGSRFLQFLPVVEYVCGTTVALPGTPGAEPAAWSVSALGFGEFMNAVFDQWVKADVGQVYVQLFDAALAAWCGLPPGVCVFDRTCSGNAVIEHNGDLYLCDHLVYPRYRLGNVLRTPLRELMRQAEVTRFAVAKSTSLPPRCQRCPYLPACNGECPQHRHPKTGVNLLCEGYRLFFDHAAPTLDRMRALLDAGRAPAEVMG